MGKLETPLLIVGHGHNATLYIARVFQSIGLQVGHGAVCADGSTSWAFSHLLRTELPNIGLPVNTKILHQTRNPLFVINSILVTNIWEVVANRAASRGAKWVPHESLPEKAMRWWLIWSKFANQIAQYRYKVEDLDSVFHEILRFLGHDQVPLPKISKTTNKHVCSHDYSWAKLREINCELCDEVISMTRLYGYEVDV